MSKDEIRQNKATKEWVIYAPSRKKRPKDFKEKNVKANLPDYDPNCPFCAGNEKELPKIKMEIPNPDNKKWQTRIVPNKFPALTPKGKTNRTINGIYLTMESYGRHEVIIEHDKHNCGIAKMSFDEARTVIETYHKRYLELMQEHKNMITIIFKNYGKEAGSSLLHPHSQLISTGFVPRYIRWRSLEALRYYDELGKCVFCDILKNELKENIRIVMEKQTMAAFVPYAAGVPYEVWIMPKKHQADFGKISNKEKDDLAFILKKVLSTYYTKLNDPDYNYIINTSARFEENEPHLHWYMEIRPRVITKAGFEIGSGISINTSIPEEDAGVLRKD